MVQSDRNGEMMESPFCFHGAYERAVDAKGRFNLPFRFRRGGGAGEESYVATSGPDRRCLAIFPREEWTRAFLRAKKRSMDPADQAQVRRLSAGSQDLTPDAQGRVAVSPDFLGQAGIGRKILVVGMGHYMEVWDPDTFRAEQEALSPPDQDFRSEFFY